MLGHSSWKPWRNDNPRSYSLPPEISPQGQLSPEQMSVHSFEALLAIEIGIHECYLMEEKHLIDNPYYCIHQAQTHTLYLQSRIFLVLI